MNEEQTEALIKWAESVKNQLLELNNDVLGLHIKISMLEQTIEELKRKS